MIGTHSIGFFPLTKCPIIHLLLFLQSINMFINRNLLLFWDHHTIHLLNSLKLIFCIIISLTKYFILTIISETQTNYSEPTPLQLTFEKSLDESKTFKVSVPMPN